MRTILTSFLITLFSASLFSQIDTMALKTPEGVCAKMLEFISFDKDEVKNWDEYRNLFLPNAQKMSFRFLPGESLARQARGQNIEEFVRNWGPSYSETGFEEYVIGVDVKEFNGIASVFQSFYCKTLDGSYEARGVNTYQVVFLNNRWWIASSMFTNETESNKLPDELLFAEHRRNIHDLTTDVKVRNHPDYDKVYNSIENYVLAIYEVDQSKIKMSVDTSLRKIGYWYDLKNSKQHDDLEMTHDELYDLSADWNKNGKQAGVESVRTITIFDIGEKIAVGKINAVWGVDHFHIAKVDGQWKIKNIIWEGKG